jgi:uridine kinase
VTRRVVSAGRSEVLHRVASRIAAVRRPHPVRVAIDGVDAAGKTTFADDLAPVIEDLGRPVIRASVDGFHHPAATRRRRGPLSPEGYFQDSFNHPALREALLLPLGPGGSLTFRRAVFDVRRDDGVNAAVERADPAAILLLDGVFLLRPELRSCFDFSVFLRVDFALVIARAEARDVHWFGSIEEVRRRYRERYVPGQRLYLESAQPERWASMIIDNNDPDRPVVERAASDPTPDSGPSS